MNTRSAKAKGRRLSLKIKKDLHTLLNAYGIQNDDIIVTPAGVNGPDLQLSPKVRTLFDFDIECKNQERLNFWKAIEQLKERGHDLPLLAVSKNNTETWVAVPSSVFFAIYQKALQGNTIISSGISTDGH